MNYQAVFQHTVGARSFIDIESVSFDFVAVEEARLRRRGNGSSRSGWEGEPPDFPVDGGVAG